MKIISLNVWGGSVGKPLLDFFMKYKDVDVFLLQEVYHHGTEKTLWREDDQRGELFSEIGHILSDHEGYFAPAESDEWGLAAFIKKEIIVEEIGDVFVHRWKNALEGHDGTTIGKNFQYIKIPKSNAYNNCTLVNFHGLWNGKGKTDTPERLEQSRKVRAFIDGLNGNRTILCGDFNLLPDTESLEILEKGMRNLIKDYNITSTRSHYYKKEIKFADYVLVSQDIKVRAFEVLQDQVSDHLPLFLEFE